ncbi:MAG: hypothetical protein R3326_00095 [Gemmatimonadota bacterium]|nr:hypothetical protein [Gemmatimonadota bacterium]
MKLKRAFDAGRWPRWLAGTLGVLLFLGVVATVTAEPPERLKKDRSERSLTGAAHIQRLLEMDRNRVIMLLTDVGEIGSSGSSVAGGGFWITTQNQYIFSSGINIGAEIPNGDNDGNEKDTAMYIGGPFSQLQFGSVEFAKLPNAVGLGHGATAPAGIFWDSTHAPDAENFPDPCTVDAFRISLFPSLQPFDGQPFPGFADQTVCWATNDITGGICADCGGKRLGAESVQTAFAFGVPAVQDFVFTAFRIFNRSEFINASNSPSNAPGPYEFENAVMGFAIDPDVGDSGDDQITFFPDIGTMIYWDSDFSEPGFVGTPGFGAVSVFPVPDPETGEAFSLENFTVFVRGTIRPDPESPQEWYEGLTGDPSFVAFEVQPTDIRGMTSTNQFNLAPGAFVEIYAAYFFAPVAGSPPSLLLAENPFADVQAGIPDPDANDDPAFNRIVTTQQTAQATFDAGFVVPTAPPKPDFTLIPGDHQVTVTWDGSPVDFVNPFAKVARDPFARLGDGSADPDAPGQGFVLEAGTVVYIPARDQGGTTGFVTAAEAGLTGVEVTNPAFNPDFVIQDFEGFRVYRSLTGSPEDAELIAQFDQNNLISGGIFCTSAVPVFDEGEFVENVCTSQEELNIGTNSGLGFAIIDRGGTFPNPSDGPGLINGIPVFYTVTSFSVNPGQSPVDIPEGTSVVPGPAPLVLEAGLAPFQSATPRSNPSSLVDATIDDVALLDGTGSPVGDVAADIPVGDDPTTFAGPIPPADAWDLSVNVVQPTEIPESFELLFRIDSVSASPGFAHHFGCGTRTYDDCLGFGGLFSELPGGDSRSYQVWFTATDGAGNVLETPTGPATGNVVTQFISFTGVTNFTAPELQILSPEDPSAGVALTTQYSSSIGRRARTCSRRGSCVLTTPGNFDAGAPLPAGVASADFSMGVYGVYRQADVEITWGNQNGQLTLTNVVDISNNAEIPFRDAHGTQAWGFSKATGLAGPEDAFATAIGTPRTDDGKVLFPDPHCTLAAIFNGCGDYGWLAGMDQAAPIWTDLPVNPDAFEDLEPFFDIWAAIPFHQPGALSQTASFVNVDGKQMTRLYLSGHYIDITFDQLPADGDTWLVRVWTDAGNGDPPRPPVPGMAIRAAISGGTSELADADLSAIRVVPNPFVAADEIQRGRGLQRIQFTNLPPQATVRIYTISGNLVRVLEHTDGSGTLEWDVRTRFDLLAASGNYYFHVTTPDGRTHLGRFAVVN